MKNRLLYMPKPEKYSKNTIISWKLLIKNSYRVCQHITRTVHWNQGLFIPGIKGWFNMGKYTNWLP